MKTTTIETILTRAEIEDALAAKVRALYPERTADLLTVNWVVRLRDWPGMLFRGDEVAFLQATTTQESVSFAGDEALTAEDFGVEFDDGLVLHDQIPN
jgi:hypothetical protein